MENHRPLLLPPLGHWESQNPSPRDVAFSPADWKKTPSKQDLVSFSNARAWESRGWENVARPPSAGNRVGNRRPRRLCRLGARVGAPGAAARPLPQVPVLRVLPADPDSFGDSLPRGPQGCAAQVWGASGPGAYLARRGSGLQAPRATPAIAAIPGAARRPYCPPSLGRRSPPPPAAASHFLPAFPFFGRKPLPGPGARRANSSALPRPRSRSPRKSQLSSRRAPRFLIKSSLRVPSLKRGVRRLYYLIFWTGRGGRQRVRPVCVAYRPSFIRAVVGVERGPLPPGMCGVLGPLSACHSALGPPGKKEKETKLVSIPKGGHPNHPVSVAPNQLSQGVNSTGDLSKGDPKRKLSCASRGDAIVESKASVSVDPKSGYPTAPGPGAAKTRRGQAGPSHARSLSLRLAHQKVGILKRFIQGQPRPTSRTKDVVPEPRTASGPQRATGNPGAVAPGHFEFLLLSAPPPTLASSSGPGRVLHSTVWLELLLVRRDRICFGGGGIQDPIEVATSLVFGGRTSWASLDSLPRTLRSVSFGSGFPKSTTRLDTQNRTIRKAGIGYLAVAAIE
ncbi:hypothetical protein NN561_012705 [Cricetulus griseus]